MLIKKCGTELLKLVLHYIAERFSSVESPSARFISGGHFIEWEVTAAFSLIPRCD